MQQTALTPTLVPATPDDLIIGLVRATYLSGHETEASLLQVLGSIAYAHQGPSLAVLAATLETVNHALQDSGSTLRFHDEQAEQDPFDYLSIPGLIATVEYIITPGVRIAHPAYAGRVPAPIHRVVLIVEQEQ